MNVLLIIAVFAVSLAGPLWLVMGRIHTRAKAARVSATRALILAFFGYMFGVIAMAVVGTWFLTLLYPKGRPPDGAILAMVVLSGVTGATVGAGAGYVHLWSRTTRDPDYDDRRGREPSQSLEADVPEARDRDHVRPD